MGGRERPERAVGFCGNPNVGKSTLFNRLTGLRQHTGNWCGKTVGSARGRLERDGKSLMLVDTPGCCSLFAGSGEERAARDYVLLGGAEKLVVVCDASCLARGLVLALEVLEITGRVILCVNLVDEARSRGITVDTRRLSKRLGVPVCGVCAATGEGVEELARLLFAPAPEGRPRSPALPAGAEACLEPLAAYLEGLPLPAQWLAAALAEGEAELCGLLRDQLCLDPARDRTLAELTEQGRAGLMQRGFAPEKLSELAARERDILAEDLAAEASDREKPAGPSREERLDRILTHRWLGIPVMAALLGLVLWLTVWGANYPSDVLGRWLFALGDALRRGMEGRLPGWLVSAAVDGVWRTTAWVVSVMLPPMAIFFPLFTLLEDLGYLPRVAFNLDGAFARCSACGKQGLTMCQGLGCNAVGVTGCRIIDSPRERLIAILTNGFMPCNGRFPTLIALSGAFFAAGGAGGSLAAAGVLTGALLLGVGCTFLASRLLGATILRGSPSSFVLELPPYRKPRVGQIIVRSLLDRTAFVLGRAVTVAAPAGLVLWVLANTAWKDTSLLEAGRRLLEPAGLALGMDGAILLGFVLGFPANEIVLPVILMCYTAGTSLVSYQAPAELVQVLTANGWTPVTAVCVILFTLLHWPCGTTLLTVRRETGSWKWAAAAAALPTIFGVAACLLVNAAL